jgi:hypothetical protein
MKWRSVNQKESVGSGEIRKSWLMAVVCAESFSGWNVGDGVDELLLLWLSTSKAVETDFVMGKIDFSADETMKPKRIKKISTSLNLDLTMLVRATQVDDSAFEWKLVIGFPVLGERASCGRSVNTWCRALPCCERKAIGTILDGLVVLMHESLPDPLLPAAVEALDDRLEPGLMGWREDGNDVQLQAEPDDTTKGIRKLACSTKNGVVVELGIFREAVSSPVCNQRFRGGLGGPRRSHPTGTKAGMQTDPGHDVHVGAATQAKVFDEVETIDVRLPGSEAWHVPAFGRRRPTNSRPSVESASAQENSADRANGGNRLEAALFQGQLDHHGAVLSQVALLPELLTNSQDQILNAGRRGDLLASSPAGPIEPDHASNTIIAGALYPTLNSSQCHTKLPSHRTLRPTPSNSTNNLLSTRFNPVFCSRKTPGSKDVYSQSDSL